MLHALRGSEWEGLLPAEADLGPLMEPAREDHVRAVHLMRGVQASTTDALIASVAMGRLLFPIHD